MGQVIGTPAVHPRLRRFSLLPKEAVENMWKTYNLLGEAWGLNIHDVRGIMKGSEYLVNSLNICDGDIGALFAALDTDLNGLVDALEMIVAIGLISGLDSVEKCFFVFSVYDFESRGSLSNDEVSLMLRSNAKAMAKIFPDAGILKCIDDGDIELHTRLIYAEYKKVEATDRITSQEFKDYCISHPVIVNWLELASLSYFIDRNVNTSCDKPATPIYVVFDPDANASSVNLSDLPLTSTDKAEDDEKGFFPGAEGGEEGGEDGSQGGEEENAVDNFGQNAKSKKQLNVEPVSASSKPQTPGANTDLQEKDGDDDSDDKDMKGGAGGGEEEFKLPWFTLADELRLPLPSPIDLDLDGDAKATDAKKEAPPSVNADSATVNSSSLDQDSSIELPPLVGTIRYDAPEDVLEPLWIHGFNCGQGLYYQQPSELEGGLEEYSRREFKGYSAGYTADNCIVYSASRYLLLLQRSENSHGKPRWTQLSKLDHQFPIASIEFSFDHQYCVTTEEAPQELELEKLRPPVDGRLIHDPVFSSKQFIHVWSMTDFRICLVNSFPLPMKTKILMTSLSSDNEKLLVIALEDHDNTFALIYGTFTRKLIAKVFLRSGFTNINDVSFCTSSSIFAVGCTTGLDFYVEEGKTALGASGFMQYTMREAMYQIVGQSAVGKPVLCVTRFEGADELATGSDDGHVLFWHFRSCIQCIKVHKAAVVRIVFDSASNSIVTCGVDGKVAILKLRPQDVKNPRAQHVRLLDVGGTILATKHSIPKKQMQCVHPSLDGSRLVLSVRCGEIMELCLNGPEKVDEVISNVEVVSKVIKLGDDYNNSPVISSHLTNTKIFDVCATATGGGFLTCGADSSVRLWSSEDGQQKCLRSVNIDAGCVKVCCTQNFVAVGMDATVNPVRGGCVQVYSLPDFAYIVELKGSYQTNILDMKFALTTPADKSEEDPESFLVVSTDKGFYVYRVEEEGDAHNHEWPLVGSFQLMFNAIHFDVSTSGTFIRAMGSGQEFCVAMIEPDNLGMVVNATELLNSMKFNTSSVIYQWDTKGVFNHLRFIGKEAMMIPTCDRHDGLFLTGHDDGTITLTRLPAPEYRPAYDPITGLLNPPDPKRAPLTRIVPHNSIVKALAFIDEGKKMVSVGYEDGLLIVWKVCYDTEALEVEFEPPPAVALDKATEEEEEEEEEDDDEDKPKPPPKPVDSDDDEDARDGKRMYEHLTYRKMLPDRTCLRAWMKNVDLDPDRQKENADLISEKVQKLKFSLVDGPVILKKVKAKGKKKPPKKVKAKDDDGEKVVELYDDLPQAELKVNWIHGFSARKTKNSLRLNSRDCLIYPAGSNIVIYDKVEHEQIIIPVHRDNVSCMDIHTPSQIGASCHIGAGMIRICVWNALTGYIYRQINVGFVGGVSALQISHCGRFVMVACQDMLHSIIMFDLHSGVLLSRVSGGPAKVMVMAFSQGCPNGDKDSGKTWRVFLGGIKHFQIIEASQSCSRVFSKKTGIFGLEKKSSVNCVSSIPLKHSNAFIVPDAPQGQRAFSLKKKEESIEPVERIDNEFVAGLSNGMIAFVSRGDRRFSTFIPVQEGEDASVTSLLVTSIRKATPEQPNPLFKIFVGCTKGVILVLNEDGMLLLEHNPYIIQPDGKSPTFNLNPFSMIKGGYRSLAVDKDRLRLFFGTSAGEISEIEIESGMDLNQGQGPLLANHFRGQLNALAVHPQRQEVLTVGDDKVVRIWDLEQNIMINQLMLPHKATCACITPNGVVVCVGMAKPTVVVNVEEGEEEPTAGVALILYMNNALQLINVTKDAANSISCLVFTPDCSKLYVGSIDTMIYVYDAQNNFTLLQAISGHDKPLANFDMSLDGQVLISYGTTGEIVFWDAQINSPMSDESRAEFIASTLEKQVFAERQGCGGKDAMGIFRLDGDFQEMSALCQSKSGKLLVTGDVFGTIRMYAYPNKTIGSPHRIYRTHSAGGVAKLSFTFDDKYLISIGKHDKTVTIWKVQTPPPPTPEMKDAATALAVAVVPTTAIITPVIKEESLHKFDASFQLKGVWFLPPQHIPPPPKPDDEVQPSAAGGAGKGSKKGSRENTPHNSEFHPEEEEMEQELSKYVIDAQILSIAGVAGHRLLKVTDTNVFKGKRPKFRPRTASGNFDAGADEDENNGAGAGTGGDDDDRDKDPPEDRDVDDEGDNFDDEEFGKKKKKKKGKKGEAEKEKVVVVEKIKPFPYSSSLFALPIVKFCGSRDMITCSGKIPSIIRQTNGVNNIFTLASGYKSPDGLMFDDIGAVAISSCARFMAIGNTAAWDASVIDKAIFPGAVNIFQTSSYEIICSLPDMFTGGVVAAAFSYTLDMSYLAVLCGDISHTVFVFNSLSGHWHDCELMLTCAMTLSELSLIAFLSPASQAPNYDASSFRPGSRRVSRPPTGFSRPTTGSSRPSTGVADGATDSSDQQAREEGEGLPPLKIEKTTIAVAGVGGLYFLDIKGNNVEKTEALSGPTQRRAFGITSMVAVPYSGQIIVGNGEGELYAWFHPSQKLPPQIIGAGTHKGPISALHSYYWNPLQDRATEGSFVPVNANQDNPSNTPGATITPSKLANSSRKVVSKLKTSTTARLGFVSGSKDKLVIWDSQTLTAIRAVVVEELLSIGHFTTCVEARFKITDDKDFYITSISSDVKFKRLVVALSSSQIIELAVDSNANNQILYCDTRVIKYFDVHPIARDVVFTVTTDNMVNAFSMSNKKLIGQIQIPHRVSGIFFISSNIMLVGMGDCDGDGKAGAVLSVHVILHASNGYILSPKDPSSTPSAVTFTIVDRLHNVGRGGASTFKVMGDRTKLSIASEDGFVYLAAINETVYFAPEDRAPPFAKPSHLQILGGMKAYASNVPVSASDFSTCGKYIRAYGNYENGDRYVTVDFFDIVPPVPKTPEEKAAAAAAAKITPTSYTALGRKILDPEELETIRDTVKWASMSSPAVPELRGLYLPEMREGSGVDLVSFVVSQNHKIAAASYSDGFVRIYKLPLFSKDAKPIFSFNAHLRGPVWMQMWSDNDEIRCLKSRDEENKKEENENENEKIGNLSSTRRLKLGTDGSLGDSQGGGGFSLQNSARSARSKCSGSEGKVLDYILDSSNPDDKIQTDANSSTALGPGNASSSSSAVAGGGLDAIKQEALPSVPQTETYKILTHGTVDFTYMTWVINIRKTSEDGDDDDDLDVTMQRGAEKS